jgi:hypothetical protein
MRPESKILIVVVIIVFIFCLMYKSNDSNILSIKKEHFTDAPPTPTLYKGETMDDTLNNLNDFVQNLSSVNPSQIDQTKLQDMQSEILENIKALNATIYHNSMKLEQQAQENSQLQEYSEATDLAETADIKASQLMQNSYIQKLQERLNSLKLTYQNLLQNQNLKKYPKIPVYSSCVVSEATGDYTLNNESNPPRAPGTTAVAPYSSNGRVFTSGSTYNPNLQASRETGDKFTLDDFIEQISKKGVNINFNV